MTSEARFTVWPSAKLTVPVVSVSVSEVAPRFPVKVTPARACVTVIGPAPPEPAAPIVTAPPESTMVNPPVRFAMAPSAMVAPAAEPESRASGLPPEVTAPSATVPAAPFPESTLVAAASVTSPKETAVSVVEMEPAKVTVPSEFSVMPPAATKKSPESFPSVSAPELSKLAPPVIEVDCAAAVLKDRSKALFAPIVKAVAEKPEENARLPPVFDAVIVVSVEVARSAVCAPVPVNETVQVLESVPVPRVMDEVAPESVRGFAPRVSVPAVRTRLPASSRPSAALRVPAVDFSRFRSTFPALVKVPVPEETTVVALPGVNPDATRVRSPANEIVRPTVACPEASIDAPAASSSIEAAESELSPVTMRPVASIVSAPATESDPPCTSVPVVTTKSPPTFAPESRLTTLPADAFATLKSQYAKAPTDTGELAPRSSTLESAAAKFVGVKLPPTEIDSAVPPERVCSVPVPTEVEIEELADRLLSFVASVPPFRRSRLPTAMRVSRVFVTASTTTVPRLIATALPSL